jgi:inositol oxygenase
MSASIHPTDSNKPLQSLEEVEDFYKERYPEPMPASAPTVGYAPDKQKQEFRNYEANARTTVREFYRLNHSNQTYDFAQAKRKEFLGLNRMKMGVWEAAEYLNQLVDDSDPDTDMSQLEHLLQTAEQLRTDGQPRWMIWQVLSMTSAKSFASGANRSGLSSAILSRPVVPTPRR